MLTEGTIRLATTPVVRDASWDLQPPETCWLWRTWLKFCHLAETWICPILDGPYRSRSLRCIVWRTWGLTPLDLYPQLSCQAPAHVWSTLVMVSNPTLAWLTICFHWRNNPGLNERFPCCLAFVHNIGPNSRICFPDWSAPRLRHVENQAQELFLNGGITLRPWTPQKTMSIIKDCNNFQKLVHVYQQLQSTPQTCCSIYQMDTSIEFSQSLKLRVIINEISQLTFYSFWGSQIIRPF